jgi:hypothetical protein
VPIERYQRPLTPGERSQLEVELAYFAPETLARRHQKERLLSLVWPVLMVLGDIALTLALIQAGVPPKLPIFGCPILFAVPLVALLLRHRDLLHTQKAERNSSVPRLLTYQLKQNKIGGWRITASACACLYTGDEDRGFNWLLQVEENSLLLLDERRFDGTYPMSDDATLPLAAFTLDDTGIRMGGLIANDDGTNQHLVPQACLCFDPSESDGETPVILLPNTAESLALTELQDGDLFNFSLAALLENPMALLKTRTGNLWETG